MSDTDLKLVITQKCQACAHFKPLEGGMGFCAVHEARRPERYWCDSWTPATASLKGDRAA